MAAVTKTLENPIVTVGNLIKPQSLHIKSLENSYLYSFTFYKTIKKLRHQPQKQPQKKLPRLDVFSIGNSDVFQSLTN